VPLPAIIFNKITFPLQMLASQAGEFGIASMNIPVLREGNIIVLAHTKLEVVEACSGIRSLVSLLTLGIVYAYFIDDRAWVRWVIALSAIPVAIVSNAMRITGTGIAAHYYGPEAAEGFFHSFSGWAVFVVAFLAMLAVKQLVVQVANFSSRPRLGGATA
jgi:exosortase